MDSNIRKFLAVAGFTAFSAFAVGAIQMPSLPEDILTAIFGVGSPENFGQGATFVGGAFLILFIFLFKEQYRESGLKVKSTPEQLSERYHPTVVFFSLLVLALLLFVPYTLLAFQINSAIINRPFYIWLYIFLALNSLEFGFKFIPHFVPKKLDTGKNWVDQK